MSRNCYPPRAPSKVPPAWVPTDSCDCHVHVLGPYADYPLAEDRSYSAPESTAIDLTASLNGMGFSRAVIVTATAYGYDNEVLKNSLQRDSINLRGVAVVGPDCKPHELQELHDLGVRGIRLNLYRANGVNVYLGGAGLDTLRSLGGLLAEMGWHVQIWINTQDLQVLLPQLLEFKGDFVVDSMCRVVPESLGKDPGFDLFCSLLVNDRFYGKLCGADRLSIQGGEFRDVDPVLKKLVQVAPQKLLWGSDWPHVGYFDRLPPSEATLLQSLYRCIPDANILEGILVRNPARLYQFDN